MAERRDRKEGHGCGERKHPAETSDRSENESDEACEAKPLRCSTCPRDRADEQRQTGKPYDSSDHGDPRHLA